MIQIILQAIAMLDNTINAQGFFHTTLNKPGVCADIAQACSFWQTYSHKHNIKNPLECNENSFPCATSDFCHTERGK